MTDQVLVNIDQIPEAAIEDVGDPFNPFSNCGTPPYTLEIEDISSTIASNVNYTINWGDNTTPFTGSSVPAPLTHTFTDEGFSIISVIVEGQNGCADTSQYSFYQGGTPAVGLSIPTQPAVVCAPNTIAFPIENIQDNPEGTLYTVTVNDGSDAVIFQHPPPAEYVHTFFTTSCGETSQGGFNDAFSVTIEASNPCGQASSTVEPLNISTSPIAIIETDIEEDSTCLNNVVEFCNINLSGSFYSPSTQSCSDIVTSDWTITPATGWMTINGTTLTDECVEVEFTDPGMYIIDLISENPCGPDDARDTIIITEPVFAEADAATTSGSDCAPKEVTFANTSLNFASVEWTVSPNTGWMFAPGSDPMTPAPTIIFTEPGTYTVTLTVENDCGDDTWEEIIEVIGTPILMVDDPPNGCETAIITPNANINDNGGPVISCLWEFPGGIPASSTDCDNPPMVTFDTPGDNPFFLSVTNECGTSIDTGSVFINNPNLTIFGGPDTTICENNECLDWTPIPNGGVFSGDITTSEFCPPDVSVPTIFTGVLAFGPQGCQSIDTFSIEVLPIPEIDLSGNPTTVCTETLPFALISSPIDGEWSGPGVVADTFNPMGVGIVVNDFNTIFFTSSDTSQIGGNSLLCSSIDSISIFVEGPTAFTFPDTLTFCQIDEDIVLETELSISEPPGSMGTWDSPIFSNINNGTFNPGMLQDSVYEVFYNYSSPNGCESTTPLYLNIEPAVIVDIEPDIDTVCATAGSYFFMVSPPGIGVWDGPGVIDVMTGEIDLAIAGPGLHTYTYSIDNISNCDASDSAMLQVFPGDAVTVDPLFYACITDGIVDLPMPSSMNGTWSGPNLVNGNQVDVTGLIPGDYIFEFTAADVPQECASVMTTLTLVGLPIIAFEFDSIACINVPINFTNNSTNADIYSWDFGDTNSSTLSDPSHTYAVADSYNVTLTGFSINPLLANDTLCTASLTQSLEVSEPPLLVEFSASPTDGCEPLTVTFDNESLGEDLAFTWDFGGQGTSNLQEPGDFTFNAINFEETLYEITLSVDNNCGDSSFVDTVIVSPMPLAQFGTNFNSFCSGDTLLVNDISLGEPTTFNWSFGDGMPATSNEQDPEPVIFFVGDTAETYDIILMIENNCGMDQDTQTVVVEPTDVEAFFNSSTMSLCVGDTITFTSFATPGAIVTWDFGDTNTDAGDIVTHAFDEPGSYQIVQYAFGCGFDSIVTNIDVLPLPDLDLVFDDNICAGAPVNFEVISSVAQNLLYYGDGDSTDLIQSAHIYDMGGNYPLTVVGTSGPGCMASITANVNIINLPIADFTFPDSACVGDIVNFESTGGGSISCVWTFGDGGFADGCLVDYPYSSNGIFQTTLVVTNVQGCQDSLTQAVYVRQTPDAFFTLDQLDDCIPSPVQFTNQSTQATGLSWDFGDTNTDITANPLNNYLDPGTYTITLTASNEGICFDEHTETITVFPIPEFTYSIEPLCTELDGTDLIIDTDASNFVFVSNDKYEQPGDFHPGLEAGDYLVEVESENGCINEELVNVLSPSELLIFLDRDSFEIQLGESVDLFLNINQQDVGILWTPFTGLSDTTGTALTATPTETITYLVEVVNEFGCIKYDTAYIKVNVDRTVFIPNTFTPNNDGINDFFGVLSGNPALLSVRTFRIFDRWGEVVFESYNCQPDDANCQWDGNFRGKKAEQGVYTYFVELLYADGEVILEKNNVMLIR